MTWQSRLASDPFAESRINNSNKPLSYREKAFLNGFASFVGALVSGLACPETGISCLPAFAMATDAIRNFGEALTGDDPLLTTLIDDFGMSDVSANKVALATDVTVATITIKGAVMHQLSKVGTKYSSTKKLVDAGVDMGSAVNSIKNINKKIDKGGLK